MFFCQAPATPCDRLAIREGDELKYMHQDHLNSTSVMTDDSGDSLGAIKYLPFGETRSGSVPTDKKFTGQELDGTALYYYGARYYDPKIGRFISADTIVPDPANPQSFNRYSYCLNNPLKYIDPSGHVVEINGWDVEVIDALLQISYLLPPEILSALAEVINSPEYQAYSAIRSADSTITSFLESSDTVVKISGEDMGILLIMTYPDGETKYGFIGGGTYIQDGEIIMEINNNEFLTSQGYITFETWVMRMAHELVHAFGSMFDMGEKITNSAFEENLADLYSSFICNELGIPYNQISPTTRLAPVLFPQLSNHHEEFVFPAPEEGGNPFNAMFYFWLLYLIVPR
jgi:RHS repeat-associated protein